MYECMPVTIYIYVKTEKKRVCVKERKKEREREREREREYLSVLSFSVIKAHSRVRGRSSFILPC